jgi:hypothetical protein
MISVSTFLKTLWVIIFQKGFVNQRGVQVLLSQHREIIRLMLHVALPLSGVFTPTVTMLSYSKIAASYSEKLFYFHIAGHTFRQSNL